MIGFPYGKNENHMNTHTYTNSRWIKVTLMQENIAKYLSLLKSRGILSRNYTQKKFSP